MSIKAVNANLDSKKKARKIIVLPDGEELELKLNLLAMKTILDEHGVKDYDLSTVSAEKQAKVMLSVLEKAFLKPDEAFYILDQYCIFDDPNNLDGVAEIMHCIMQSVLGDKTLDKIKADTPVITPTVVTNDVSNASNVDDKAIAIRGILENDALSQDEKANLLKGLM